MYLAQGHNTVAPPAMRLKLAKLVRVQRSGINTIKYHT